MASISGWSHVAVSVTDLERSVAWYRRTLDLAELFAFETEAFRRVLLRHDCGVVLSLTQHRDTSPTDAFDPTRVGLDHLSFRVADEAALEAWTARLDDLGIAHGGVQGNPAFGSRLVAFRDPDGQQLELYVQTAPPPAASDAAT